MAASGFEPLDAAFEDYASSTLASSIFVSQSTERNPMPTAAEEPTMTDVDETITPEINEVAESDEKASAETCESIPNGTPEPSPADILDAIRGAELIVSDRESKWLAAKEEAKDCKEDMDAAINDLRRLIRAKDERLPLFDGPDVKVENVTREQSKDAWRPTPVESLGLPGGIVKSLTEAGLTTLGHLADYSANNDGITGIKGIGTGKAEKVSEAMDQFWSQHPEHCREPEPEVDESAEEFERDQQEFKDEVAEALSPIMADKPKSKRKR